MNTDLGYTIRVKTGNKSGAGTDSHVYIQSPLFAWEELDNTYNDDFEKGNIDEFLFTHKNAYNTTDYIVGKNEMIPVYHEGFQHEIYDNGPDWIEIKKKNWGAGSDWYLDWIEIQYDGHKNNRYTFNGWIKDENTHRINKD